VKKPLFALCLILVPALISFVANGCSKGATQPEWNATNTPTSVPPTASYTPTFTKTNSPTSTATGTPTSTSTSCMVGGTPCTATDTFTATATFTPTSTSTPVPGWHFDGDLSDTVNSGNSNIWGFNYNPNNLAVTLATWDGTIGDYNLGSAQLEISINGPNQKVDFALQTSSTPLNFSSVSACSLNYYFDSASTNNSSAPDVMQIFIKDSNYLFFGNTQNMPTTPGWQTVSLSMASAPGAFIKNSIYQVGLEISTPNNSSVTYAPVTVHVDDWVFY